MTHQRVGCLVLIVALTAALAAPARADNLDSNARNIVIGIVAVTAAIAVTVTVLVMRRGKKDRTITGCVGSGPNGMTITSENDQKVYALTGDTAGIKPGDRMSLRGKKIKSASPDRALLLDTKKVISDFGVCQP